MRNIGSWPTTQLRQTNPKSTWPDTSLKILPPNFTIFGAEITVVAAAKVCDFLGEQKTNEVFPEVTTGHQDIMRSI